MFVRMAHTGFMNDCLDDFIVGMCMHHLGMEDMGCKPISKQILITEDLSDDKMQFIAIISSQIQRR